MPGLRKTSRRSNKHHKNQTRVRKQSRIRKQKQKKRRTQKQNKRQKRTLKGGHETPHDRWYAMHQHHQSRRNRKNQQEKAAEAREAALIEERKRKNREFFWELRNRMKDLNLNGEKLNPMAAGNTWKIIFFTKNKLKKKDTKGWWKDRERYFMLIESDKSDKSDKSESVKLLIWYDMADPDDAHGFNIGDVIDEKILERIKIHNGMWIRPDTRFVIVAPDKFYTTDETKKELKIVDGINIKRPNNFYANDTLTLLLQDDYKHEFLQFLKNKNIKQTTEELNEAIKSGDEQQVKYATQSAYNYGIDPGTIYKNAMTFQFYQNEAKNEANRRENATTAALSRTLHSS